MKGTEQKLELGLSSKNKLAMESEDSYLAAIKEVACTLVETTMRNVEEYFQNFPLQETEEKYMAQNITWTSCKDFNVELGMKQIEEYISTLPVEVFFIFESTRLVHRPGQSRFREKWLKDIIESKLIMMESITF
ncbi:uncharacterized protein LOC108698443 isoform X2 [Xenopus laevis]|uniref:Uncharacterized protein LOC108698443 isoform X2 n=1 Tax=Xenopus laevis TaxID=8355 RepID=A0A8J0TKC7_XENLA|nr:uncharacterized protein LOC108698443 isoform X2 [Xenopus laevis]